jgi:hypothetical protein
MALLGNYSILHKSPAKYLTGTVGFGDRSNFNKPGMMRNRGNSAIWRYDAQPSGSYAGRAYMPPVKAGRIVSRQNFKIDGAANGGAGLPASASLGFTIDGFAAGGLIAGGVAVATISINANGAISGLVSGQSLATINVQAVAAIGATAFGVALSTLTVSAACQPYGLGYMQATTVDNSVLTPQTIASSVWAALASANNSAGTMGALLNASGAGGDPWAVQLEGQYTAADLLRIVSAVLAGKVTGMETGNPVFRSVDDVENRVSAVTTPEGNRTAITINEA